MDLPPPPRFFEAYTPEAVATDAAPRPPALPVDGNVTAFGIQLELNSEIIKPIEAYNFERLFASGDYEHGAELKKLNGAVMQTFLQLLDAATTGNEVECKNLADRLNTILTNMHHLLNEFRPHEAVHTIKTMLERQLQQRDEMATELRSIVETTQQQAHDVAAAARQLLERSSNAQQLDSAESAAAAQQPAADEALQQNTDYYLAYKALMQLR